MAFYDAIHTTKRFRLGTRKFDIAGNEYMYCKGAASVVAGDWCTYDDAFGVARMDTDVAASVLGHVCVAKAAVDSTAEFGWFAIFGVHSAGAADVADNAKVFASSTVGLCDDSGTAGLQVVGAIWRSEETSALASVQLNYPTVGVNVA